MRRRLEDALVWTSSQASAVSPTPIGGDDQAGDHPHDPPEQWAPHRVDHLDGDVRVAADQHAGDDEGEPDQGEPRQLPGPRPAVDRQVALSGLHQHQEEDQQQRGDADRRARSRCSAADRASQVGGSAKSAREAAASSGGREVCRRHNRRTLGTVAIGRQGVAIRLPSRVECAGWPGRPSTTSPQAAGVATSTVSRAFSNPDAGQRADPGAGARGRRRARLPAQPARPRAAVRAAPHGRDGGLRHHQPALLRADPRRGDAGQGIGVHARPRQRRGVPAHRVRPDPAPGAVGGRLRPRRQPAARTRTCGRSPPSDRSC